MKPLGVADPTTISSYRLLGVLGSGGMGRVYLAQSATGRRLAIKVIRHELADNPVFRRRFAREVAAVRAVSPLFTAAVVDADPDAESPWLATTYIDGPSLEQWVAEHGPLAPEAVLTLAAGLAEALGSIHGAGLVHRDLKPGNVLLDDAGPHIIDFGIAQTPDSTRLTTSLVGTPAYMAPERLRGAEAAAPADVFSLGATLAFAATGRRLADGDSVYEQVLKMTAGRFDLSTIPQPVRRVVTRCVSRRARERPTAAELTQLLSSTPEVRPARPGWYRHAGAPAVSLAPEPTTLRLPRRQVIALGSAFGVAAVVGGGAALVHGLLGRTPPASAGALRPGSVLWQAASGATTVTGEPGSSAPSERIAVDPSGWTVTSVGARVIAMEAGGHQRWTRTLTGGPFDVRLWGDAVLVSDARRVWLLDGATGAQRSYADVAGAEAAVRGVDPNRVALRQVALLPDRAFLDLSGTTVALDRALRRLWRAPSGSPERSGQPSTAALAASAPLLAAADRSGSTVRAAVYDAGTGGRRWSLSYELPAMQYQQMPPPPPPGDGPPLGPPPGFAPGGPPPSGPPPPPDAAWQRGEVRLGGSLVALRNAGSIQVRRTGDGGLAWQYTSPMPVAGIEVCGDLLLVAADVLTAYALPTGRPVWHSELRGARLAALPDGRTVVAATGHDISAFDPSGAVLWRADLPAVVDDALPDRLTVQGQVGYLTLQPSVPHGAPLPVDVLAVRLNGSR
ncbi:serine/threonine-protein kinase [Rugosimonospora acidiphila]